jgi:hypothetical protein
MESKMNHPIYKIISFEIIAPYTLKIKFNDHKIQVINFYPILKGALYGPLKKLSLFNQVKIDPEVHTLVWPNGADFDPATLHDWDENYEEIKKLVNRWEEKLAESVVS